MSAEPLDMSSVHVEAVPAAVTADGRMVPSVPAPDGWTVLDVDAPPEREGVRDELVDGVPRVMTPPRVEHQDVVLEAGRAGPGQVLGLDAPFSITLEVAALYR